MAGDIRRQRKSWTLQDRSKVSLNILRANLADDGDENAQLEVAKRLLEETPRGTGSTMRNQDENTHKAVYWLIKSSEQGNDEATQLLKECLRTGRGVTAQNILDVRTCVTTPKYEKLTFKAARLLHRDLSNGEEFITTIQLLARVNVSRKNETFQENSNGAIVQDDISHQNGDNNLGKNSPEEPSDYDENEGNSTDAIPLVGPGTFPPRELNKTFIFPSSSSLSSASGSVHTSPDQSPNPSLKSHLKNQNHSNNYQFKTTRTPLIQYADLEVAMKQPGKKLTLADLLNVAEDFNLGNSPHVSIDKRNKLLERYMWYANSFINTFVLQFLLLAVVGNFFALFDALSYLILFGTAWSSYNLLSWELHCQNFKDWEIAFRSMLHGEKWRTEGFKGNMSKKYILPHLMNALISLVVVSFCTALEQLVTLCSVGILIVISIQLGILQKSLPGWRKFFILCATLMYYQPSNSITNLLIENFAVQTKCFQETLNPIGDIFLHLVPFSLNGLTVLTGLILATTVKGSLYGVVNETLPEIVSSLWLIKIIQTFVILEVGQLLTGIGAGILLTAVMVLLCSKLKLWKVAIVILFAAMVTIVNVPLPGLANNSSTGILHGTQGDTGFLEWEEYDASCHQKAWTVQTPAATQIKCSTMYDKQEVKWKGRVSIVKVEQVFTYGGTKDVVFGISVGILSNAAQDDGSRNWQSFLSGSADSDTVAPASVVVSTREIRDERKKQNLIDHILNLRTGDKIEFSGRLTGSQAGSLKPQIEDVQSLQCLSCAMADYGEFIVDNRKYYGIGWFSDFWNIQIKSIQDYSFFNDCKTVVFNLFATLQSTLFE